MTALAETMAHAITIDRVNDDAPILFATGRAGIGIRAGTTIRVGERVHAFERDISIPCNLTFEPGRDYGVGFQGGDTAFIAPLGDTNPLQAGFIAGFHFAPSACAEGTNGGDGIPAINPHSIWDVGFRPVANPCSMACVDVSPIRRVWIDIYLLGVDHITHGTSRHGATIADGRDLPVRTDGKGKYRKLDYATATEICAHHGKRPIGAEEFFAAAYGVKERCARGEEPDTAGSMSNGGARFVSKWGIHDATGTMWQWGTDGHPDDPRPSLFGGSWLDGSDAGSRYAFLDYWAEGSYELLGCRAASDHLSPARLRESAG